ncbi:MAG: F0F1 ATP synthase subunit B [Betaproteobacteria bacterium TMED156]|nr:MAG: F0F1 ATP synthase subunit B [Betaproteobacteria bacterium TMED156]
MNLNATLIAQLVVFFILAWFTMRFVWPPIMQAIDERTRKIAEGLEASEKSKEQLLLTENKVKQEMKLLNDKVQNRISDAEKRASIIIDEAKLKADIEAQTIIDNARKEAANEALKIRDQLRSEVSKLALIGAEKILKNQIDKKLHATILKDIEAEL